MVFQFFFPQYFLRKFSKINLVDEAGLFYAAHWGILVFVLGLLLIYAGYDAALRVPVLIAVIIEKTALVYLVFSNFRKSFAKGLLISAVFDSICVILYTLYLLG